MRPKRTGPSPKTNWDAKRDRYTWHLRKPYCDSFDRTHWWKKAGSKPSLESALYESARRHPMVWRRMNPEESDWVQIKAGKNRFGLERFTHEMRYPYPDFVHLTTFYALVPWVKLNAMAQQNWRYGMFRRIEGEMIEDQKCQNLLTLAKDSIVRLRGSNIEPNDKVLGPGELFAIWKRQEKLGRKDLAANPAAEKELESAIAAMAVQQYRDGYLLISIAPGINREEVPNLAASKYREHFKAKSTRAHWPEWLDAISDFESGAKKSQDFARYRRVIDRLSRC